MLGRTQYDIYQEITFTIDSAGATPGRGYEYAYTIGNCSDPDGADAEVTLTYDIETTAAASHSHLEVDASRAPVLGQRWSGGAVVRAADAEGDPLPEDYGQVVSATLSATDTTDNATYFASCMTQWTDDAYEVECDMPDVARAGFWALEVSMDGEVTGRVASQGGSSDFVAASTPRSVALLVVVTPRSVAAPVVVTPPPHLWW